MLIIANKAGKLCLELFQFVRNICSRFDWFGIKSGNLKEVKECQIMIQKKHPKVLFKNVVFNLFRSQTTKTFFELVNTTASINNTLSTSVEWVTS